MIFHKPRLPVEPKDTGNVDAASVGVFFIQVTTYRKPALVIVADSKAVCDPKTAHARQLMVYVD